MNESTLLPDDEPVSMPSERTMRREGEEPILGRIDQYALLRKLGGGGFGVVYLARDGASGVEVALKTLHPLLKHSAEEMDLLREKFRLVHVLTHPNIAKALMLHPCREIDVWDETARRELNLSPGDSMMVMDYAPGVTLSKWRRQFPDGVVPADLALEVGRQVAAALDYAHSERIVHRDIKPGNIMVETVMPPPAASQVAGPTSQVRPATCDLGRATRIRVRILDFGLAAEIRSSMSRVSTEAGDTSGTRPYMAPEQWMGRKQDGRTDQYALACVLYELLSGAPPFAGVFETGDPIIMRTTVLSDVPEKIGDVPPNVNAALLRALAKDPKDRFLGCAAFVKALSSTPKHAKDVEENRIWERGRFKASRRETENIRCSTFMVTICHRSGLFPLWKPPIKVLIDHRIRHSIENGQILSGRLSFGYHVIQFSQWGLFKRKIEFELNRDMSIEVKYNCWRGGIDAKILP